MKKILLRLILILQIFALTSCKEIDSSTKDAVSLKSGIVTEDFSIDVPQDYEETSSQYIEKYFVKDNSASIIVTNDTDIFKYNNITEYYQNTIKQYQNTFDEFEEISVQDVTIDNEYTAKLSEFSYKIISDTQTVEMSCYVEYILVGSSVYIVTCSAPSSSYPSYKVEFERSLDSIKVTE